MSDGAFARLYRGDARIDFPALWRPFLIASAVALAVSIGALGVRGINFGIDFEGGSSWEVDAPGASVEDARDVLAGFDADDARIQLIGDDGIRIRSDIDDPELAEEISVALEDELGTVTLAESVGPTWGDEVTDKAVRALVVFFVVVAAYIAIRLEWKMAVGALVAVVHDMVISVGVYALFQFEVTPATIVAFLTIMGYSLYDTIVVYDKVHEISGRLAASGRYTYTEMFNLALNRVIMRSINTSITSALPVASLVVVGSLFLGAVALQEFAIALLVGILAGAYSTIFIASPLVVNLKEREPHHRDVRAKVAARTGVEEGTTRVIDPEEVAVGATVRAADDSRRTSKDPRGVAKRRPTAATPGGAIPPRPRKKRKR